MQEKWIFFDFGEVFYDFGVDGKSNIFENGYDEKNNPDPNNDDFHPVNNPTGTENNGKFDIGETYQDFGTDRTKNDNEFRYSIKFARSLSFLRPAKFIAVPGAYSEGLVRYLLSSSIFQTPSKPASTLEYLKPSIEPISRFITL